MRKTTGRGLEFVGRRPVRRMLPTAKEVRDGWEHATRRKLRARYHLDDPEPQWSEDVDAITP